MAIINIGIGILFIALGFLVKSNPNLIAGYNGMTNEQKDKVDIEGLSSFMKKTMVTLGVCTILGHVLFAALGFQEITFWLLVIIAVPGIFIMAIFGQKFYPEQ